MLVPFTDIANPKLKGKLWEGETEEDKEYINLRCEVANKVAKINVSIEEYLQEGEESRALRYMISGSYLQLPLYEGPLGCCVIY